MGSADRPGTAFPATVGLVTALAGVYLVELAIAQASGTLGALALDGRPTQLLRDLFQMGADWPSEPYVLITKTLAHGKVTHLVTNLVLIGYAGRSLEARTGPWWHVGLFLVIGAIAGIAQVTAVPSHHAWGASGPAMAMLAAWTLAPAAGDPLLSLLERAGRHLRMTLQAAVLVVLVSWSLSGAVTGEPSVGHASHLVGLAAGLALGVGLLIAERGEG